MTLASATAGVVLAAGSAALGQVRAFPEAFGFGQFATGGRGGTIYRVTNLNNSGAGSFRDAVSQPNRIVVFDVGGYINLTSELHVKSNITILGQTAPGDGIGLTGAEISMGSSSNIIARYLRVRPGSTSPTTANGINLYQASNIVLDHVSVEFAKWNNLDAVNATNITVQNSLIADPIGQQFGAHTEGGGLFTWHGNLWANGHNRQPLAKANTQYINNIVYNYQAAYTSGNTAGFNSHDVINNYFITGPATTSAGNSWYQLTVRDSMYTSGNLRDSDRDGVLDGGATSPSSVTALSSPWHPNTQYMPALSATNAYHWVLADAGASLVRDDVDDIIVAEVQSLGTAGPYPLPSSQTITGLPNNGFGTLNGGSLPTDTDGDYLPDAWESAHGLSPNSPNPVDDPLKLDPLGYRYIERYANDVADTFAVTTWSSPTGAWTNNAANWDNGVPTAWHTAQIRGAGATNGIVTNFFSSVAAVHLSIGGDGPDAGERVVMNSGTLNVYGITTIGDENNGMLQIAGGTVIAPAIVLGNQTYVTGFATHSGSIEMTGGTLRTARIVLGAGSPGNWTTGGSLNLSGGTILAIGHLSIDPPITVNGNGPTIDVSTFTGAINGPITGSGGLTKRGAGTLTLAGDVSHQGATTVEAGTLLAARLGTGSLVINGGLVRMSAKPQANDPAWITTAAGLSIDPTDGVLDLTNNSLLIDYSDSSPADSIRQLLLSGQQSGFGMISSMATSALRLGYVDDGDGVLIEYALGGDANLDGVVNIHDLMALAGAWQSNALWQAGDFDYNGIVDARDLGTLATNWQATFAALATTVPEPAALATSLLLSVMLRRRRPL